MARPARGDAGTVSCRVSSIIGGSSRILYNLPQIEHIVVVVVVAWLRESRTTHSVAQNASFTDCAQGGRKTGR